MSFDKSAGFRSRISIAFINRSLNLFFISKILFLFFVCDGVVKSKPFVKKIITICLQYGKKEGNNDYVEKTQQEISTRKEKP